MTTHLLSRPDGKTYKLELNKEETQLLIDKIYNKEMIRVRGEIFPGNGCRLDRYQKGDGQSPLELGAKEVFALESGEKTVGFWETIYYNNHKRKEQGKPWLFAPFVEYARRESGATSPQEVLEFIEAESENLDWSKNKAETKRGTYDRENREMIKKYLETDEGREYAMKHNIRF